MLNRRRLFGLKGFAHVLLLIGLAAILGAWSARSERDIELGLVETVLLEILERLDGFVFDGIEVLGLVVFGVEFGFLFMGFEEEALHFFHDQKIIGR